MRRGEREERQGYCCAHVCDCDQNEEMLKFTDHRMLLRAQYMCTSVMVYTCVPVYGQTKRY